MKTYALDLHSHLRHLWLMLFLLVLMPFVLYFLMIVKYDVFDLKKAVIAGVLVFVVFILPMLILHFNYYSVNKGSSFSYNELEGEMIFKNSHGENKFNTNEIDSIICHKSWPMSNNRSALLPWDIYNYAEVRLKNGQILKISSLLVYEFDKQVISDTIEIKKRFYPWIL